MRFPSRSTLKKFLPSLKDDTLFSAGFQVLNTYKPQILQLLQRYQIQLVLTAAVVAVIACVCYIVSNDPVGAWEYVRNGLVGLKDSPWLDLGSLKPKTQSMSIFDRIDNFVMSVWTSIVNTCTSESMKQVITASAQILAFGIDLGIKLGDFVMKHWVSLTAGTITLPLLHRFNVLFFATITDAVIQPIFSGFKMMLSSLAELSIAYRSFESTLRLILESTFGGLSWIITFPVNVVVTIAHWVLSACTAVLMFIYHSIQWAWTTLRQIATAIYHVFFPPRPLGDGSGGSSSGGGGSSGSSGGSSGRYSPTLIGAAAVLTTGTVAAVAGIMHHSPASTSGSSTIPAGHPTGPSYIATDTDVASDVVQAAIILDSGILLTIVKAVIITVAFVPILVLKG